MRIHHSAVGDGHPLILVHGWGVESKRNWIGTGWVDVLSPIRQVVLMDVRGHGRSDAAASQADYGYAAMSADVLTVMDKRGIERADYFGYSMGAFMGAWLLGHHSDRFSSMILGGIGDETPESAAVCTVIADSLRAEDPASITDPVGRLYRRFVDADASCDREALAMAALEMWPDGHPLDLGGPGLGKVAVPVLIVNGADDHPYVDSAARFADAIPGADLVEIPGTDHHSVVTDQRFKDAVVKFLGASREAT